MEIKLSPVHYTFHTKALEKLNNKRKKVATLSSSLASLLSEDQELEQDTLKALEQPALTQVRKG